MFTGIIEEVGTVETVTSNRIYIKAKTVLDGTKIGDSIAINGVCLTVTKLYDDGFDADVSQETMKVTTLNILKSGSLVNLERALAVNDRLGGHFVTGHVDGRGKVVNLSQDGNFYNLKIELEPENLQYIAKKGSVTIDGISLTVADMSENSIKIAVIPHTFENTNLKSLNIGEYVNVETDILAKYVEKFLLMRDNRTGISMEYLLENGFC